MFPKALKKSIARFLAYLFLMSNVSPAFAHMQYCVHVGRREVFDEQMHTFKEGFFVEATKREIGGLKGDPQVEDEPIFQQLVVPFAKGVATQSSPVAASLMEILQKQRVKIESLNGSTTTSAKVGDENIVTKEEQESENEEFDTVSADGTEQLKDKPTSTSSSSSHDESQSITVVTQESETELSRGYCLNIPEIGDLLISHDGDIVLDANRIIGKSLKVSAPSQVILNNTTATEIEIEAATAVLTGKHTTQIDFLNFYGSRTDDQQASALFIDQGSELKVSNLSLRDALLLNAGKLDVAENMDLNEGIFLNTGLFSTTAAQSTIQNISYLFNGSAGSIDSTGSMIIGAGKFSNLGRIKASSLSLVSSDSFKNDGIIEADKNLELNVMGRGVNTKAIKGKGAVSILGSEFQNTDGSIKAAEMAINTDKFVNLADIVSPSLSIQSSELFRNNGNIETEKSFRLTASGISMNNGAINGKAGTVLISGKDFQHINGFIRGHDIEISADKANLAAEVSGQEGVFRGDTSITGSLNLQHGIVEGKFANFSDATNFGKRLDLVGKASIIKNKGKISSEKIVSNADSGVLSGGEVTSTEVVSKKHLQLSSNMPKLTFAKAEADSKLLIKDSAVPQLKTVQNFGETSISAAMPELTTMQNDKVGKLRLESPAPIFSGLSVLLE